MCANVFASAEPEAKPSGVANMAAPSVAPVVITAGSSQYISGTYTAAVSPFVASSAKIVTPVAAEVTSAKIADSVAPVARFAPVAPLTLDPLFVLSSEFSFYR